MTTVQCAGAILLALGVPGGAVSGAEPASLPLERHEPHREQAITSSPSPDGRRTTAPATIGALENLPAGAEGKGTRPVDLDPWVTANRIIGHDSPLLPAGSQHQAEPHLFRSRANPAVLLCVFQDGRQAGGGATINGYAVSPDGGRTWRRGLPPALTVAHGGTYFRASDPVAAIDLNGALFLNNLSIVNSTLTLLDLTINRSFDGGGTWSPPIKVVTGTTQTRPDKNWITVNDHPGSPHANRLAVTYTNFTYNTAGQPTGSNLLCTTSDDAGTTWQIPSVITPMGNSNQGSQPLFLPDGSLIVFYATFIGSSTATFHLEYKRSLDGGVTWPATATRVRTVINSYDDPALRDASFLFSAALAGQRGDLFLAWTEVVAGSPSILVVRSTNGGTTWSTPVKVNGTPAGVAALFPTISSSLDGAVVSVTWVDKRHGADAVNFINVYGASSLDGGASWGPDFRLSDRTTDLRLAPATDRGYMIGDYFALAAGHTADQPTVAVWIDTRAGQADVVATRYHPAGGTAYDDWKRAHFLPAVLRPDDPSAPDDDPDGDGWANALEYAYALDPYAADSGSAYSLLDHGDVVVVTEPFLANRPTAPGFWEYSLDRVHWHPATPDPGAMTVPGVSVLLRPEGETIYFRRVITLPNSDPVAATEALVTGGTSTLVNLSTRAQVGTGEALLIGGFVTAGGELRSLIRGVGPSLATFDVAGALDDPWLEVITPGQTGRPTSDNWGDESSTTTSDFTQVGAFPLSAPGLDAALVTTLPGGTHSVLVRGVGERTGIALVEVYAMPSGLPAAGRLINLSTRALVGAGDAQLIGGFVLRGDSPRRLLIRAVGPSLSRFGINNPLADPQVHLFRAGATTPIASNDDVAISPSPAAIRTSAAGAGAFALDEPTKDAALVVTLEPGIYSAVVSGVNGTTGIALVEVYALD